MCDRVRLAAARCGGYASREDSVLAEGVAADECRVILNDDAGSEKAGVAFDGFACRAYAGDDIVSRQIAVVKVLRSPERLQYADVSLSGLRNIGHRNRTRIEACPVSRSSITGLGRTTDRPCQCTALQNTSWSRTSGTTDLAPELPM
jgi:hypothetical protein